MAAESGRTPPRRPTTESACVFLQPDAVAADPCRLVADLALLFDVHQLLEQSLEPRNLLRPVLERLAQWNGTQRGRIRIESLQGEADTLEEVFGEKSGAGAGESDAAGLVREVVSAGVAQVVDDIAARAGSEARRSAPAATGIAEPRLAFLCVPIRVPCIARTSGCRSRSSRSSSPTT